jgi:hypothetical protein
MRQVELLAIRLIKPKARLSKLRLKPVMRRKM